jgi:preprotein translocase subunit SecY
MDGDQMPSTLPASVAESSLSQRIAITLAVLALYRLGEWVPLPGVDPTALMERFQPGEFSSMLGRMSIFALGVVPILSALIVYEIAKLLIPPFKAWEDADAKRRATSEGATFVLALAFAAFQGFGIALALEAIGGALVPDPGFGFRAGCIATFMAATALISWLASIITRFGVGSGFWILLAAPVLVWLPQLAFMQIYMWGPASSVTLPLMLSLIVVSALALVTLSKADETLIPSGQLIWPPMLAYSTAGFLYVPFLFILSAEQANALLETLKTGHPVRLVLVAVLIVAFFLLRAHRGQTRASSRDAVSNLPAIVPALTLAAIATAGDYLIGLFALPLMLDGRALIIILAVALSVLAAANPVRKH